MEKTEIERIESYVVLFNEIKRRTSNDEIAIAILAQIGKDSRLAKMQSRERRSEMRSGEQPATQKQRAFLERLGTKIPDGLTKAQASAMIDEAVAQE